MEMYTLTSSSLAKACNTCKRVEAMRAISLCLVLLLHQCLLQAYAANVLRSSLRSCKVFIAERYFSVTSLLRRIRTKRAHGKRRAQPAGNDTGSSSSSSSNIGISIETTNSIISRLHSDNSILREQLALLRRTINTQKTTIKDVKKNSVSAAEVESIVKHNKELLEENAILNDTLKEKEALISNLKAQNEDLKEEHKKEVDSIKKELFELQKNELALKENIESYKKDIESVKKDLKAKVGELLAVQQTIKAKDEMLISNLDRQDEAKKSSNVHVSRSSQTSRKGSGIQVTNINFSPSQAKPATASAPKPKEEKAGVASSSSSSSIGTSNARTKLPDKKKILVDSISRSKDIERKASVRVESAAKSGAKRAAEKSKAKHSVAEFVSNSPSKKRQKN